MNVLYVTHELPFPAIAGHHHRTLEIIAALPRGARVHLVGYCEHVIGRDVELPRNVSGFDSVPGLVRIRKRPLTLAIALASAVLTRRAYSVAKYRGVRMSEIVGHRCRQSPPDVIIASIFTQHQIPAGPWKIILDTHNIEHALWHSFVPALPAAKAAFVRREARLLEKAEREAWHRADGAIAICAEDMDVIAGVSAETPIRHVPVRIAAPGTFPQDAGTVPQFDVGLLGVWSWAPNAVAAACFAQQVMPELARSGLRVRIAGRGLDRSIRSQLEELGANCTGYVEDVGNFYRSVRIIAAPYLYGGGVRMKVAEALGWERPVIGTPLAFQGIAQGVPSDWIVTDVEDLAAVLIRHAADPPRVPPELAEAHSHAAQRRAMSSLFKAVGVPM